MNTAPFKVMVVEDERIVAFNLRERLTRLGYSVSGLAASGEEALRKAHETAPDLILMDIRIEGDMDGIETARRLAEVQPTPVVYLTAHSEDSTIDRARQTQPYGYLLKPFSERELHATIQMAMQRRRAEAQLQVSEERLHFALDAAEMGAWDLDPANQEVTLTERSRELLGFDQPAARWEAIMNQIEPEDQPAVRDRLQELSSSSVPCHVEFRRASRIPPAAWLRMHAKRVTSSRHGESGHLVGVVKDVTRQRLADEEIQRLNAELEQRILDRTAQLEESNKALEMFNHSIAHDLRGPVRAMSGFSSALLEDLGDKLDDQSRDQLSRINAAAQRLDGMIDGLLDLSRVSSIALDRQPVDLTAIAQRIARELKETEPERPVAFSIAPGMVTLADPRLIEDVLENLLRNAWKYTSNHSTARIEFGFVSKRDGGHYFVRDDGAGFDMKYASQLFKPFGRLHAKNEFPGTGIGLSTVRRIIERHGGQIWADAEVEKGTTFYFTLPSPA